MKNKPTIVSAQKLAEILGITDRRVQQLATEAVFEREKRGAYDLSKCVQAYIDYRESKIQTIAGSKEEEEARLAHLRGNKIEREIKVMDEELIPAEDIGVIWCQVTAALRSRLLSIPASIKTKRPDVEMEIINSIESEIKKSLEEASNDGLPQRYRDTARKGIQSTEAAS